MPRHINFSPTIALDYNKNPLCKTTLDEQVFKDADQITSIVQSLAREVQELRGEVQSVQSQQLSMAASQAKMLDSITNLNQHSVST